MFTSGNINKIDIKCKTKRLNSLLKTISTFLGVLFAIMLITNLIGAMGIKKVHYNFYEVKIKSSIHMLKLLFCSQVRFFRFQPRGRQMLNSGGHL